MKRTVIFAVTAVAAGMLLSTVAGRCAPSATPASTTADAPSPPPLSDKDKKQMQSEQKQGADVAAAIEKEGKLSKDQALIDRVNKVGQKIAAVANQTKVPSSFGNDKVYPFTWTFHVVDDKEVNAFSLPGGYVYVNSGLLKLVGSDDELAGVLAHEITHAAHHHIAKMAHEAGHMNAEIAIGIIAAALAHASGQDLSNLYTGVSLAQQAIMNNHYSEDAERDADHGGIEYMQKAGYNPIGMLTFMEKLQDLEHRSLNQIQGTIFQDHPYTDERVGNIEKQLASMGITPTHEVIYHLSTQAVQFTDAAGADKLHQIKFQDTVCATIYDPDGTRTAALVTSLNTAMERGLQIGDISSSQNVVLVDNRPWLKVTASDAAATPGKTAEAIAKDIAHSIQVVLYRRSFLSTTANAADAQSKSK